MIRIKYRLLIVLALIIASSLAAWRLGHPGYIPPILGVSIFIAFVYEIAAAPKEFEKINNIETSPKPSSIKREILVMLAVLFGILILGIVAVILSISFLSQALRFR